MEFKFPIYVPSYHRYTDPKGIRGKQVEVHKFLINVNDIPDGLPDDPNPREANVNHHVAKKVGETLEGIAMPMQFKNKGFTIVANKARRNADTLYVEFVNGDGLLDGGHTYSKIMEMRGDRKLPENYVHVELQVGLPPSAIAEIAEGRNTSIQVKANSLADLRGAFDWIKDAVKGKHFAGNIGYHENQAGALIDVVDLIRFMAFLNVDAYPVDVKKVKHPTSLSHGKTLEYYESNFELFKRFAPLIPQILYLVDYINWTGMKRYNDVGGKAGNTNGIFSDKKTRLVVMNKEADMPLLKQSMYMVLAPYRNLVTRKHGVFEWVGNFVNILEIVDSTLGEVIHGLRESIKANGGKNAHSVLNNADVWDKLFRIVRDEYLSNRSKLEKSAGDRVNIPTFAEMTMGL